MGSVDRTSALDDVVYLLPPFAADAARRRHSSGVYRQPPSSASAAVEAFCLRRFSALVAGVADAVTEIDLNLSSCTPMAARSSTR
jgi:hypothetical protein